MIATSPMSAAAQFRLGNSWGQAPVMTGVAQPVPPATAAGGGSLSRFHPQHPMFWVGALAAAGLVIFGYATERGIGVRVSGQAGPIKADAGVTAGPTKGAAK